MSNAGQKWWEDYLRTHKRPGGASPGGVESSGTAKNAGQKWWEEYLKTHNRPTANVNQEPERDEAVVPSEKPSVQKDAEIPAAGNREEELRRQIKEQAAQAEEVFGNIRQAQRMGAAGREAANAAVQAGGQKTQTVQYTPEEWKAEQQRQYDNSVKEMKRLEREWQELTDKMPGGLPSAEDQRRLDELKNQYEIAVRNRDAANNQLVMRADLEILASWPEEDRALLIQYALNDHKGRSVFERSSESATRAATALVELQKKYDKDTIKRLSESYQWYQNEIATKTMQNEAAKEVQGKPGAAIVHSGLTVPASLAGAVTAPLDYLGQVFGRTGRYSTLDPNARGNLPNVYSGAVRQQVASDIEGDGKSVGRKVASYLYQGGMSALDSGARLLASGGNPTAALTLAGLGSFGQTVSQASAQGASPAQAIAYGTVAAGIEVLTEKLPLDELMKTAKGGWKGLKPALKEVFKQAGIEVTEEEISLISTTLFEMAILQEKASYNQRVQQLVNENGMTLEEATEQANYELLGEALDTAAVSAISGSFSSAGSSTISYMGRDTSGTQTAQEGAETARSKETTVAEVTADTAADQQQTQAEEPQSNVLKAVQEFRDTGKVSNRMAEVILNDAESVAALQKETGMELPDTASGRRNAVKDAVAQLSRNEDAKDLISSTAEALLRKQEQPQEAPRNDPAENRRLAKETIRELAGVPQQQEVVGIEPAETEKESGASAIVATGSGNPPANSTPNSTIRVADLLGLVKGDAEKHIPKANGEKANTEHGAVGAAEAGFSKVDYELLSDGNEQRDRPNDVRPVSVNIPKKDASGKTISDFAGNLFGSELTPDTFADTVQQMAFDGNFSYDPTTNEEALTSAAKSMEGQTIDGIVGDIVAKAETGKFKTEDISRGILMYGFLAGQKDSQSQKKAAEICVALSKFATASGRNLQLFSIFRRMTPEGQMMAIQQTVRTSIADLVRKGLVKKDTQVDIDQALLDEYRKAAEEVKRLEAAEGRLEDAEGRLENAREETRTAEREAKKAERKADRAEERANQAEDEAAEILAADQERIQEAEGRLEDANKRVKDARKEAKRLKDLEKAIQRREQAEQAIYADAAAKMKVTFKNKWDTWRYMAMLGNVKTQVRNFGGNIAYMPHTELKRLIGAILEKGIAKEKRTKAIVGFTGKDAELRSWAKEDAKTVSVHKALEYSAKLGDSTASREIRDRVRVFKEDWLEGTRKVVEAVPSAADMLFKEHEYINSMAGFLKARGYDVQQIRNGAVPDAVLNEGRAYAINEAMKATFNDSNKFSDAFANLRYIGDNVFLKALNIAGEGILPFRRTPANIVVRFAEGTIFNSFRGVYNLCRSVKNDKISAATAIDQISAGLSGTAMSMLGYFLASGALGFIRLRGSGVDEDEERQGHQKYALEVQIDGKWYSYKIDWLAPSNLPLFVGANIYDSFNKQGIDGDMSLFTSIVYGTLNSFEPLLALSCLSGLNDLFQTARYADEDTILWEVAADIATGYFTQGIPALVRQTAQAATPNERQTFANSSDPLLRDLQSMTAQIPAVGEVFKTDRIDAWGNEEDKGGAFWQVFNAFINPGTPKAIDNSKLETEINRLNSVQPESITPPEASKKISYTDSSGKYHDGYRLTEEEYTKLRQVQGKTAYRILQNVILSSDYKALTDAQKAKVFEYAYAYAGEKGREAALDGYRIGNSIGNSWMLGINGKETGTIINKVALGDISESVSALNKALDENWNTAEAAKSMETAYKSYKGLSSEAQRQIKQEAGESAAGLYIAAREAGVTNGEYVKVLKQVAGLKPQSGYKEVRPIQKAQEAGSMKGFSDAEKEALIRGYVSDSQDENIDDVKKLGLDINDYLKAWSMHDSASGKEKKERTIAQYQQKFGVDYNTAKALYEIFG